MAVRSVQDCRQSSAKKSPKGLGQGQFVESFVVLSALGGDCADDFDTLRQDVGLEAMLGYQLPAASTGRQWLDLFHEGKLLEGRPLQGQLHSARIATLGRLAECCAANGWRVRGCRAAWT